MDDRTIAVTRLVVALIVDIAAVYGYSLPVGEEFLYSIGALVAMVIAHTWAWWKNNNMTEKASKSQVILDRCKAGDTDVIQAVDDLIAAIHEDGVEDAE